MRVLRRYRFHAGTLQPAVLGRVTLPVCLVAGLMVLLMAAPVAHASVSLLLEQPYGKLNLIEPAGHSAIYLDHICAETPLMLRPCGPGELGVVLSRYDGIGNHDWVAMPLIPYLYAVSSALDIPQRVDRASELQLRDAYRRQYLRSLAPDRPDGSTPGGNWYELLGSAFDRTIYGFRLNTTADQDEEFIATFNDRRNVENYNGAFRNCADFARVTINHFYPHAVRRNYIADLGLTSPKSVARSLSHYASRHPETGFAVFVIPQVKGDLPRSHSNSDLAEYILKRYGVPLVVVSPVSTAVVLAAYIGQGRFSMPKHPPLLDLSELPTNDPSNPITRPFPQVAPALPPPARTLMTAPENIRTLSAARSGGARVSLLRAGMVP